MRTRVIGLGNTILRDDGIGVHLARALRERVGATTAELEIVESELGGFALLELMSGWERVLLLDGVELEGHAPGAMVPVPIGSSRVSLRLAGVHEADLPTLLEVGPGLGYPMPAEVQVLGIQTADSRSFGEELSPALQRALPELVDELLRILAT